MHGFFSSRGLVALACLLASAAACAQAYPAKPIRLVVPAVPGGGTDILARRAAAWLDPVLNQRVVVENIGGASGDIGTLSVVKAAPDGYSLVITNIGDTSIRPHLVRTMPFDPLRDLAPIATVASIPLMVNVNAQVPAADLRELIALAKRQPGKLFFGTPGTGTTLHIAGELFMQMTGTQLVHVPYKGQAPAILDMVAGRIQIVFTGLNGVKAALDKGTVRALAVTQSRRIKLAPGIPSADEAGLPGYEFVTWYGLAAPRGTPPAVVNLLNRHFNTMLDDPAIQQFLLDNGMEPLRHSPESFAALIKSDYDKYGRIIRDAGIPQE
jgi:tripartite-type tricarboxylate transporter receptor subunit TctC